MKYASLPVLKEWPHSFSAAPALFVFSNLCTFPSILFFIAHSNWGCVSITKRMVSALRFWLCGSQAILHQVLKVCKYIQSSGAASISPTDQVMSVGSRHQIWDEFVIFWKIQWAGTRQRESSQVVSTAYVPWAQLHSPLDVCQSWSLPLRLKLQNKQRVLLYGKTGRCASVFCLCNALRELSLELPQSQECMPSQPPGPGDQKAPLGGTCKNRGTRCENQSSSHIYTVLQERLVLCSMAEGEHRDNTHSPRSVERITVSPSMPV